MKDMKKSYVLGKLCEMRPEKKRDILI